MHTCTDYLGRIILQSEIQQYPKNLNSWKILKQYFESCVYEWLSHLSTRNHFVQNRLSRIRNLCLFSWYFTLLRKKIRYAFSESQHITADYEKFHATKKNNTMISSQFELFIIQSYWVITSVKFLSKWRTCQDFRCFLSFLLIWILFKM